MKIAMIGATEQLSREFLKFKSSHRFIPLAHDDLEVADFARTRLVLAEQQPEALFTIATFHRVEDCEEDATKLSRFCAQRPRLDSERSGRTSEQPDDDRPPSTKSKSNTFFRASSHKTAAR